jgi:hypothetical protein
MTVTRLQTYEADILGVSGVKNFVTLVKLDDGSFHLCQSDSEGHVYLTKPDGSTYLSKNDHDLNRKLRGSPFHKGAKSELVIVDGKVDAIMDGKAAAQEIDLELSARTKALCVVTGAAIDYDIYGREQTIESARAHGFTFDQEIEPLLDNNIVRFQPDGDNSHMTVATTVQEPTKDANRDGHGDSTFVGAYGCDNNILVYKTYTVIGGTDHTGD